MMYRYMTLVQNGIVYPLSDTDRAVPREHPPAWEVKSRSLSGRLRSNRGPIKHAWSISWEKLKLDEADDEGIGFQTLEDLYEAGGEFELRVYKSATDYDAYDVILSGLKDNPVKRSARERYNVSIKLEEV